jgi:hypothetical protein
MKTVTKSIVIGIACRVLYLTFFLPKALFGDLTQKQQSVAI